MPAKEFDLSDVLSIVTPFLVSSRGMEGIYKILNHMTGDNLFTHQLPRAAKLCRPVLLAQYPDLAAVDAETQRLEVMLKAATVETPSEVCKVWVDSLVPRYGRTLSIEPIPAGQYQPREPISELIEMRSNRNPDA